MTDRELMQQALEALKTALETMKKDWQAIDTETGLSEGGLDAAIDGTIAGYGYFQQTINAIAVLSERLAQPNDFNPDWDAMAVMVEEQQRMATEIDNLKRRLKSVNTAAMRLTSDLTCMEVDDDERLDRDRVMGRVMQWRNEWDKAMFKEKTHD